MQKKVIRHINTDQYNSHRPYDQSLHNETVEQYLNIKLLTYMTSL